MKKLFFQFALVLSFLIFVVSCEDKPQATNEEPSQNSGTIEILTVKLSDCITIDEFQKNSDSENPSIQLIKRDSVLIVRLKNTEFCCATDSISINDSILNNSIHLELIDHGPYSYCFCPHDVEFEIGPLQSEVYQLCFIESKESYFRDTFNLSFDFSSPLDTLIIKDTNSIPSTDPIGLTYINTDFGGCNMEELKDAFENYLSEKDSLGISFHEDTLNIFVGINQTCCILFNSESSFNSDTLIMRVKTMNDDFCDCICYYTFDYSYVGFASQDFYYQFYVDDKKYFEGLYISK